MNETSTTGLREHSKPTMSQPFLYCSLVISVELDNTIGNNSGRCTADPGEFILYRTDVTTDFPDLCKNERFIKAFDGVHRHVIRRRPFYLMIIMIME